jgi:hypothetical protein
MFAEWCWLIGLAIVVSALAHSLIRNFLAASLFSGLLSNYLYIAKEIVLNDFSREVWNAAPWLQLNAMFTLPTAFLVGCPFLYYRKNNKTTKN